MLGDGRKDTANNQSWKLQGFQAVEGDEASRDVRPRDAGVRPRTASLVVGCGGLPTDSAQESCLFRNELGAAMMHRHLKLCALLFVVVLGQGIAAALSADGVRLRSIGEDPATGLARAVVVDAGALVHTALMWPEDAQ